ncbi:DUF1593 domain-containing protein [uncultured Draconibacterium sp.]|uniref:DUF1593 domain-containing protein n=1 Tax=uncultured Draconibacterium sp. TaxID=1573823 RepID=UPI0025DD690B|nr:DUF1593 domain-containing protein [uncultured Draconibacterium sp.]
MNKSILIKTFAVILVLVCITSLSNGKTEKTELDKSNLPRLLILTDIGDDPDDEQSLIRLLVYANKFQIEGFITELWWKDTHNGRHGQMTAESQMKLLHHILDRYEKVRSNLEKHELGYPTAKSLHDVVKRGKVGIQMTLSAPKGDPMQWIGSGQDTEGSDFIIDIVDRDDPRPVDICVWGGTADLAQALLKVREERTPAEVEQFISKIRVHAISDQDDTGPWIRENFPNLFFILDHDPNGDKWESCYRGMFYGGDQSLTTLDWINENIRTNHGYLGEYYPPKTNTNKNPHGALKEGDTPSWFYFYPNGLNIPEHPGFGGWGGRYAFNGKFWQDAADKVGDDNNGRASVYRWRPTFQNDFAARMDWCVKDFEEANHSPEVKVKGEIIQHVKPGEKIKLKAKSFDPDGDKLSYKWWNYTDASTIENELRITNNESADKAGFVVPDEPGKVIHIILEVADNGTPALTAYKRFVYKIQ